MQLHCTCVLMLSTESVLSYTSVLYFSGFANFGGFGVDVAGGGGEK